LVKYVQKCSIVIKAAMNWLRRRLTLTKRFSYFCFWATPCEGNSSGDSKCNLVSIDSSADNLSVRGAHFSTTINSIDGQIPNSERVRFSNEIKHLKQLSEPSYRLSYNISVVRIVEAMMREVKTFSRIAPVILDFGCWSGTTTRYINEVLDVGCVGAEIDPSCLEFARRFVATPEVSFIEVDLNRIVCANECFDIVLANAVFANMHPTNHLKMVSELGRVTKPGGAVIIIDSNSPDSHEVQDRLRTLYLQLESPGGALLENRAKYIDTLRPQSAPNLDAAKATCYATKDEIDSYIAGARPAMYFDPLSLVPPNALNAPSWAPSNLTDHKEFCRVLQGLGFSVTVGPGWPAAAPVGNAACFVLVAIKDHAHANPLG
jgi:ubiquinone/menaquinone biosynthesis C-methylase UbiE